MLNQMREKICKSVHEVSLLRSGSDVTGLRAAQNLGGQTAALRLDRFQQVQRLDRLLAGDIARKRDDFADARRDEDAFPQPVFAGSERAAHFGVHLAYVDSLGFQTLGNAGVMLLEQSDEQMFDSDIVMVVIAALLFGGAQYAPRGWAEFREQLPAPSASS